MIHNSMEHARRDEATHTWAQANGVDWEKHRRESGRHHALAAPREPDAKDREHAHKRMRLGQLRPIPAMLKVGADGDQVRVELAQQASRSRGFAEKPEPVRPQPRAQRQQAPKPRPEPEQMKLYSDDDDEDGGDGEVLPAETPTFEEDVCSSSASDAAGDIEPEVRLLHRTLCSTLFTASLALRAALPSLCLFSWRCK